jgi:hypothetical protein
MACAGQYQRNPLSGGGVTFKGGRLAPVDKGAWDRPLGSFEKNHEFNVRWLREARRVLRPDGTATVKSIDPDVTPEQTGSDLF